jgi:hypothetical protein
MAEASVFVMDLPKDIHKANTQPMLSHINVGTGQDITIAELVRKIADITGFGGDIRFDTSKPDGTALPFSTGYHYLHTWVRNWIFVIQARAGLRVSWRSRGRRCGQQVLDSNAHIATGEVGAIGGEHDRRRGIESLRADHAHIGASGRYTQRAAEL